MFVLIQSNNSVPVAYADRVVDIMEPAYEVNAIHSLKRGKAVKIYAAVRSEDEREALMSFCVNMQRYHVVEARFIEVWRLRGVNGMRSLLGWAFDMLACMIDVERENVENGLAAGPAADRFEAVMMALDKARGTLTKSLEANGALSEVTGCLRQVTNGGMETTGAIGVCALLLELLARWGTDTEEEEPEFTVTKHFPYTGKTRSKRVQVTLDIVLELAPWLGQEDCKDKLEELIENAVVVALGELPEEIPDCVSGSMDSIVIN